MDEVWKRFKRALAPLEKAGKLGAVLFQFPPWFTIKTSNKEYVLECAERAAPLPISVELRSPTWLRNKENREETLGFLAEHRLPYVCVDRPKQTASSKTALVAATSPELAVVRFHGRGTGRSGGAPRPEASYSYPTRVLSAWVSKLLTLAEEAKTVHAVFRNAHHDFAPRNAEQLQRLLARGLSET